jgi:hypothetical protein
MMDLICYSCCIVLWKTFINQSTKKPSKNENTASGARKFVKKIYLLYIASTYVLGRKNFNGLTQDLESTYANIK